jgi:hypothetical protein
MNAAHGEPVIPADQCDEDYYSDEAIAKREAHLSAKYGRLKAAAARRAEEAQRIAEANRRSKERPPELTAVALAGADGDAQVITVAVDEVPRGRSNEC